MRIQFKVTYEDNGTTYQRGFDYELDEKIAKPLIDQGLARDNPLPPEPKAVADHAKAAKALVNKEAAADAAKK